MLDADGRSTRLTTSAGTEWAPTSPDDIAIINDIANAINDSVPFAVAPDGRRFLLNLPDRPDSLFFLQGLDALMK